MSVHEDRLRALIDPDMMNHDAWYHAQVSLFRSWLTAIEMAMSDENVDSETTERVLNRLVYGVPYSGLGHERKIQQEAMTAVLKHVASPTKVFL